MADISKIDKNFTVTGAGEADTVFQNVRSAPFRLYGLLATTPFTRLPESAAVSDGLKLLRYQTAGGRVRFRTDSPYITLRAQTNNRSRMSHMPLTGSCGFDMYEIRGKISRYAGSFIPPFEDCDGYESTVKLDGAQERELQINFPLYGGVTELEVGIAPGSSLSAGVGYGIEKPVVYYGSSITQGGCASRPGNCYQAMISRRLDADFINLGFSGNAKGELEVAEYIAGLDMSAFVLDYDHNAPDTEHLAATHKRFFDAVRTENPTLPIVVVSKPNFSEATPTDAERRDIIYNTYSAALADGDENVYFVDGAGFFAFDGGDSCTVDGTHPNDLGFAKMAEKIGAALERIFFVRA